MNIRILIITLLLAPEPLMAASAAARTGLTSTRAGLAATRTMIRPGGQTVVRQGFSTTTRPSPKQWALPEQPALPKQRAEADIQNARNRYTQYLLERANRPFPTPKTTPTAPVPSFAKTPTPNIGRTTQNLGSDNFPSLSGLALAGIISIELLYALIQEILDARDTQTME